MTALFRLLSILEEEPGRCYSCPSKHLGLVSFLRQGGRRFLKDVSDLLGSDFVGIEIATVTKACIVPEVTEAAVFRPPIVLQRVQSL